MSNFPWNKKWSNLCLYINFVTTYIQRESRRHCFCNSRRSMLARYIIKKKKRTNKCLDVQNIKTGTTFKDVHETHFLILLCMMQRWSDNMQWVACSRDKIYKMASVGDFLKQYYQYSNLDYPSRPVHRLYQ